MEHKICAHVTSIIPPFPAANKSSECDDACAMSIWGQRTHVPPLTTSIPVAVGPTSRDSGSRVGVRGAIKVRPRSDQGQFARRVATLAITCWWLFAGGVTGDSELSACECVHVCVSFKSQWVRLCVSQTDRQTDIQKERKKERQIDRQTDRQADGSCG